MNKIRIRKNPKYNLHFYSDDDYILQKLIYYSEKTGWTPKQIIIMALEEYIYELEKNGRKK